MLYSIIFHSPGGACKQKRKKSPWALSPYLAANKSFNLFVFVSLFVTIAQCRLYRLCRYYRFLDVMPGFLAFNFCVLWNESYNK